jgi:hypothetical protein
MSSCINVNTLNSNTNINLMQMLQFANMSSFPQQNYFNPNDNILNNYSTTTNNYLKYETERKYGLVFLEEMINTLLFIGNLSKRNIINYY